tara:strand:+ start:749 stop:1315 length:567 start_codon:yes stop_codon:yes gene_type:complete
MKIFPKLIIIVFAFMLIGFANSSYAQASNFKIWSDSFINEDKIPLDYVSSQCGGSNKQPHLSWDSPPTGTKFYSIIMDDPDAQNVVGYTWVHLNLYNVPVNITSISEGQKIKDGRYRKNHNKQKSYTGPCAPTGTHKYIFSIYALSEEVSSKYFGNFGAGAKAHSREKFEKLFSNIILGKSEYIGYWR